MILQLSAGMGPVECQRAVFGICRELMKEIPSPEILNYVAGAEDETFFVCVALFKTGCFISGGQYALDL